MSDDVLSEAARRLEQLGAILKPRHRVLIIPHDFPDPDALASACALHLLLEKHFHLRSQIVFSGTVSRAENKELLRRIRYKWKKVNQLTPTKRPVDCILVDTAPWATNVTIPGFARVIGLVDHHEHARKQAAKDLFADIRTDAGATTTILYQYLKAAGVAVPKWLAAIMAYAIASETLDLSREFNKQDVDAYLELAARSDLKIIGKIRHAPLPRIYYARLQEALTNAQKLEKLTYTHLSAIEQPEIVAEIADMLLRMEGIRWSFCTAYMNGGMFLSIRSSQRGARCSRTLKTVIGKKGSSGGHDSMAAGYIDMHGLTDDEKLERRQIFVRSLIRKILKKKASDQAAIDQSIQPLVDRKPENS